MPPETKESNTTRMPRHPPGFKVINNAWDGLQHPPAQLSQGKFSINDQAEENKSSSPQAEPPAGSAPLHPGTQSSG